VCRKIAKDHPNYPITAIANAAWQGQPDLMQGDSLNALAPHITERYGPVISCLTFANSNVVETSEGLVMIDCGTAQNAPRIYKMIRNVSEKPLHTVIYTHGHVDHVSVNHMDFQEPFTVIAHENCVARFDRYKTTNGYNTIINARQFQIASTIGKSSVQISSEAANGTGYSFMHDFRYPDKTYQDYLRFSVGEETFELFAGKGETDDASIIWMPEHRYCFCGDFFIWNAPNAGNPQKVQRYPEEWVVAARKILSLKPLIVFPGHGPPIIGEARVQEAFKNQALLLEGICRYTMKGINSGRSLQNIMMKVPIPKELISKPYLRPNYDDPRWFVATLWRRYCGWYTFDVRHLLPVSAGDVGTELAKLVGGADQLAKFALKVMQEGKLGIALELADMAANAEGGTKKEHEIRAKILRAMEKRETSLMARSIYRSAAIDSEKSKL
jgi:glyoxylase-like metal-dependent hydrolase (beta-lactamase superfamily II)